MTEATATPSAAKTATTTTMPTTKLAKKPETKPVVKNSPVTASTANPKKNDKPTAPGVIEQKAAAKKEKDIPQREASKTVEETPNMGSTQINRETKDASYVGWKQIGNWEEKDTLTLQDQLIDMNKETLLDNLLPESAYGDWYHAVGIFFLGGFLSFALGYFKFTLAPVFFIMLFTAILYRTSAKKYRASIRDLVQKEFTVQKIENDYESLEWLNNFLDKYWPLLEPSVSQMIVQAVNPTLATNASIPAFIKAIWIDQFTLGVKPPRIDAVKTFENTDADIVVMDWTLSFTPHDLSDMNAKQMRNYVNQKVVLKMQLFGFTVPISLSDIAFSAKARLRFKLMTPFPHIETVNFQLLETPQIDFVSSLFGDSIFNWEILAIPGLFGFIENMAKKYMGPVLLPPFSMQFNIPQLLSGSALSIGVLEINVKNAKGIKRASQVLSETIDPYLVFESNGKMVGKTKVIKNTLNPVWNETLYVLLGSFTDPLSITLYDKRHKIKDKILGRAEYNLNPLHDNTSLMGASINILRNSKPIADLNFDLKFFPTLEKKKLPDGSVEELPDLNTGIAKVVVEEARGLAEGNKKVKAYVDVFLSSKLILTTNQVESDSVFQWNQDYEAVIEDRRKARYRFVIKDANGETITSTVQSLNDLIDRTEINKKYIPLKNNNSDLKVTLHWKPVALDIGSNAIAYNPPIGVLRLFLNKANNLTNLETIGKIDPYAVVRVNGLKKGRTDAKISTLDPVWNQAIYVAITSPNQKITIECMDVESVNKDRLVGSFDVKIQDLFSKDTNDRYKECVDEDPRKGRLITKKGVRGTATFYASFYPALPVLTLEEFHDLAKMRKEKQKLTEMKEIVDVKKLTLEEKARIEGEEMEIAEVTEMFSNKVNLDLKELLGYNSGVLAVSVLSGELPQSGLFVQAYFDNNGHSRFTSPKMATSLIKTGWTGDVMIKELEWSVTTFRAVKNKNYTKANPAICEVSIPTIELVKNCYKKPSIINLTGEGSAKLMIQVQWFPVLASKLPQSDLITNCGDLTITAIGANNLISADTNGFSDPYLKFFMNDEEDNFFKTSTQKKTLDPVWNESSTVEIYNRVNDYLNIKVWDWDASSTNDLIGRAIVPLSQIDPHKKTDLDVPVTGPDGEDGGVLHLSFTFNPRYTINVHKQESKVGDVTSKGIGSGLKAGTTVVGAGFKAGTTVVGAGLGTVGKVGKFGKGLFGKKKHAEET